ncbi:beta-lactam-binding protein with PASTA domain [Larkinella arboricola]|uniref:Beta-lactam-binding protein with PASTA domain n=1 Tax=Larkinella arboricola TaxID=643671 RepID=A0A327XA98_LARAB|nr:PASTA domain-containing protein [Larkinella arboricola]RAK03034.1 beta-lactam-binding protein with PASTA domain [Larkinella arboricola]
MAKISTRTTADLLTHIGILLGLVAVLFLGFFFLYLPFTTSHGQTITVPELFRMNTSELEEFLNDYDLRYEVSDCTYVAGAEPLTVVAQYPKPGFKVKQGRKVYLTITTENPPMIPMPKLVDQTYVSAQYALASNGLQMGKLKYVPDLAQGTVLKQLYDGKEILPGTRIAKGSKIDIVVGDGLGNTMFAVPDVVGKPRDEAEMLIRGSNLQVGTILPVDDPEKEVGTVVRQNPAARPGATIRVGDVIDLWVVGPVENDDSQ